jgi:hypothetical protein
MGIFDLFTGDPLKEAAEKSRNLLQQTQTDVTNRTNATKGEAQGFLTTGFGNARGNLGQGYGVATGAVNQGAGNAIDYLDAGTAGALGRFDQAKATLTDGGGAFKPLGDLSQKFGAGATLYGDALGINGPEGAARAKAAFQTGPGYQFAMDQGVDAVTRAANARGALGSGNTSVDLLKFGQGLADQTYDKWMGNLSPYNQLQLSATQGAAAGDAGTRQAVAGIDTGAGNIINQGGVSKAGVAQGQGNTLADIARQHYSGLAGIDTAEGGALAGNATNATSAINNAALNVAPQIGKTFTQEGEASMTGSKNLWGLGMEMAKLAAGAGGAGAGGGGLSGLSSSFSNWLGGTSPQTGATWANPGSGVGMMGGVPFPIAV